MSKKNICIVIPAYNEELAIADTIVSIRTSLKNTSFGYEIVVINDGSTDETAARAYDQHVTVISHILNSGAGSATATGLRYAELNKFDIAATMDADGQHAANDVVRGIKKLEKEKYDLLIGSRLVKNNGMSRVKVLGNKGLSFITSLLFGINVTDSQSGLRVFSRHALNNLKWKTSGYEFCSEMLWRAHQINLSVGEYPIKAIYTEYSISKGQNNWNAVHIIRSLVSRRIVELFE